VNKLSTLRHAHIIFT